MKKIIFSGLFMAFSIFNSQTIVSYDFNNGSLSGWTLLDEDSDGNNWEATDIIDYNENILFEGVLASWSYSTEENESLNPDNWAITPAIDLSNYPVGTKILLKWKVIGTDPDWSEEHYSVYVASGNNNKTDFLNSSLTFSETLPEGTESFLDRSLDISSFAGQTVYLAFRHHDSSDELAIAIDDITIEQVDCLDIISNVSSTTTIDTATLSWSGTLDTYYLYLADINQTFEIPYSIVPVLISGIFYPGTTYEYYLSGKCSESSYAEWQGPFYFTTKDQVQDIKVIDITSNSAKVTWTGINSNKYDIVYGGTDGVDLTHQEGIVNEFYEITGLDELKGYEVYVRGYYNNVPDIWYGPVTFTTTGTVVPASLDYITGFEDFTDNQMWTTYVESGDEWEIKSQSGYAHSGSNYATCFSEGNDSWFFSRGINLEKDKTIKISFYYRAYDSDYPEDIKVTIGQQPSVSGQTTTLANITNITDEEYIEKVIYYTPNSTGVHYLGFHSYSEDGWYILLDDLSVTLDNMGTEDVDVLKGDLFKIYPNPAKEELRLTISDKYNLSATKVVITDISGKIIRTFNYADSSYDVSGLSAGVYIITVSDGKIKETKKLIKQ
ncbi:MAG: choice-of-anchor J domain-containing protein [Flavobacteriaceae bacterium]|jgi:hypothetical protein|nr:choice-of-anchor J domain-containing protein [Flavobacteriaceae bacterium]